jgi:hypothetical protein
MPLIWSLMLLLPALVVVVIGVAVHARATGKVADTRWVKFLLLTTALLFIPIAAGNTRPEGFFLAPTGMGTLAALLLLLRFDPRTWSRDRLKAIAPYLLALGVSLAVLVLANVAAVWLVWLTLLPGIVAAAVWRAYESRSLRRLMMCLALLISAITLGNLVPTTTAANTLPWLRWMFGLAQLLWLAVAVVLSARLVHASLADETVRWQVILLRLLLASVLLLSLVYQMVIALAWDEITDGLASVFIVETVIFASISAGMLVAWSTIGWRRWIALGFVVAVSLLMNSAYSPWLHRSPLALTEERAEQVNQAVLRYHTQNGRYPETLAVLTPWYLWRIPEPVMVRGLSWCYEGGADTYRLGYVYRPRFGAPVSVRIHAATGTPPNLVWSCDDEATQFNVQYRVP